MSENLPFVDKCRVTIVFYTCSDRLITFASEKPNFRINSYSTAIFAVNQLSFYFSFCAAVFGFNDQSKHLKRDVNRIYAFNKMRWKRMICYQTCVSTRNVETRRKYSNFYLFHSYHIIGNMHKQIKFKSDIVGDRSNYQISWQNNDVIVNIVTRKVVDLLDHNQR